MRIFSLLPTIVVYIFCFISSLIVPATAHPLSRFSHAVQTLQTRDTSKSADSSFDLSRRMLRFESRSTRLQRRGLPGAVYICTEDNFRGHCAWTAPNDDCHIPGTGNQSPKSIGPDERGFCVLYEKATCVGNQVATLRFPGLASNMPVFGGIKCFVDGPPSRNATGILELGSQVGSGILPAGKNAADPRLSGGAGSLERKKLKEVMDAMEREGFKGGMIGLKKGHYY